MSTQKSKNTAMQLKTMTVIAEYMCDAESSVWVRQQTVTFTPPRYAKCEETFSPHNRAQTYEVYRALHSTLRDDAGCIATTHSRHKTKVKTTHVKAAARTTSSCQNQYTSGQVKDRPSLLAGQVLH